MLIIVKYIYATLNYFLWVRLHQKGDIVKRIIFIMAITFIGLFLGTVKAKAATEETEFSELEFGVLLTDEGITICSKDQEYVYLQEIVGNTSTYGRWTEITVVITTDRPYTFAVKYGDVQFTAPKNVGLVYKKLVMVNSREIELSMEYIILEDDTHLWFEYGGNHILLYNEIEGSVSYFDEYGNRHILGSFEELFENTTPSPTPTPRPTPDYTMPPSYLPETSPSSAVTIEGSGHWSCYNGDWYYIVAGKKMVGWCKIDGFIYHFTPSGRLEIGWIDYKYYCNPSKDGTLPYGALMTGWVECPVFSGNYWYYFSPETGEKVTGNVWIGERRYCFDEQGKLL